MNQKIWGLNYSVPNVLLVVVSYLALEKIVN